MSDTYSPEEIAKNIKDLNLNMDSLLWKRKALNKDVSDTKKQLTYWKELDPSQYKIDINNEKIS